ncbi:MAG: 1-(5-phosphoribosyl)-5-[(5-phosphoribosylamino)methylideneamino]imidazole-4-carboxamide isomerase [Thermoleophilaceae bacterium]|nr:1-(5-phosphoribosyl)-5-[(5-phosphoribosylamino)methylideneamino]imidazole-4-carboxamide isomerase [Thermoleophilaceae bacterium]
MILLPAVDIRDGRAVRLRQGRFEDETVYADAPLEAARAFVDAGARWLHVVDLDGARDGAPANLKHLERIAAELGVPVQFGGGLRSSESICAALEAGARRVLVGTAAIADPNLLAAALDEWGERVAVAVDVRGGRVSVAGWTEETEVTAEQLIERLQERGAERFVYTNADRDGMLEGVDLDEVRRIAAVVREPGRFTISGGVGSLEDLRALRDARLPTLEGVISGKALYEHRFTVEEALRTLEGEAA